MGSPVHPVAPATQTTVMGLPSLGRRVGERCTPSATSRQRVRWPCADTVGVVMADHWWWRPGWAPGRRYVTWHLTLGDLPAARAVAERYRSAVASFPGLDVVPDPWLHLTMQGVGFVDELEADAASRIAQSASERLAAVDPVEAWLAPAQVGTEGIYLPVDPFDGLQRVRLLVRAATVDVLGSASGDADTFWPHVSVAYSNQVGPSQDIEDAVAQVDFLGAAVTVAHVDLICLGRDSHLYEWETIARVPLGQVGGRRPRS